MLKGIYSAASAMIANLARQNALTHNISNVDTPGFKNVMVSLDDFTTTSVFTQNSRTDYLGQLGLGVEPTPEIVDFEQGPLLITNNPLDFAVEGSGFFTIQTEDGVRYTRDGRFLVDAEGSLTTIDGHLVLDDAGNPITLPEGEVTVSPQGVLNVGTEQVATLGLAVFTDPEAELVRDNYNAYIAEGGPTGENPGMVQQGVLESSNVDISEMMTKMVSVSRAYEAAQQMVQVQDSLLGRVVQSLGRF